MAGSCNRTFDTTKWGQSLAALRIGNSRRAAFTYVGIPLSTAYHWMKNGASYEDPANPGQLIHISGEELTDQVEQARGAAEVSMVSQLADCTKGSPEYLLRRLKYHNPEDWGGVDQSKVAVSLEVTDKTVDAEDFTRAIESAAQKVADRQAAEAAAEAPEPTPDEAEGR